MQQTERRQILIVEDNPGVATVLKQQLEYVGYATRVAACGRDALCDAAEHRVDLVILDVKLPDISGFEVSRELRKLYHRWDVPILMLTALAQPIDELRGFAHGADAYLTKPYEATELLQTIALLLGQTTSP